MEIDKAVPMDVPGVLGMIREHDPDWTADMLEANLQYIVVAKEHGNLIGVLIARPFPEGLHIDAIVSKKPGVGKTLLRVADDLARAMGFDVVVGETRIPHYFRRLGWEETGEQFHGKQIMYKEVT